MSEDNKNFNSYSVICVYKKELTHYYQNIEKNSHKMESTTDLILPEESVFILLCVYIYRIMYNL